MTTIKMCILFDIKYNNHYHQENVDNNIYISNQQKQCNIWPSSLKVILFVHQKKKQPVFPSIDLVELKNKNNTNYQKDV